MTPNWLKPIEPELGDDIDFILNCVEDMDETLKEECFEVFKRAVVLRNFVSKEDAGIFVARRFPMFSSYLHKEWQNRNKEAEDMEFRKMIEEYGKLQLVVDEETETRDKEVKQQERQIMNRIRTEIESKEEGELL